MDVWHVLEVVTFLLVTVLNAGFWLGGTSRAIRHLEKRMDRIEANQALVLEILTGRRRR